METVETILAICGAISVVGGAGAVIYKVMYPAFHLSKRVGKVEKHQDADYKRLEVIEEMQKQQNKALAAMLNHQIDGNGIENMKNIRNELLDAVINN